MKIQCEGLENAESIIGHVKRNMYMALGRYIPELHSVSVRLRSLNTDAPRSECSVSVQTGWRETFRFEETDSDILTAASRVADLAGRLVARQINLRQLQTGRQLVRARFGD